MKKTLIILVLLFSSSLFAGDDLTGKKILCIRIVDVARIMSFDFVSNKAVEYSSYTGRTNKTYRELWHYNTSSINVKIFSPDDLNNYAFIIDRKNLEVRDAAGTYRYFPKHCELIVSGNKL